MKPTPEQIAAAKAWARESMTKDDALQLAWSEATPERILLAALEAAEERANIANRVLAAYSKVLDVLGAPAEGSDLQDLHEWAGALKTKLEAAEQDTARLDWLEEHKGIRPGNCDRDAQSYYILHVPSGYDYYKGGKSLPLRDAIDAARKAQP